MKRIIFLICIICTFLFFFQCSIAEEADNQKTTSTTSTKQYEKESIETQILYLQQQNEDIKKLCVYAICGITILMLVVLVLVFKKSKSRNDIIEIVLESHRIRKEFASPQKHQPQNRITPYLLKEKEIDLVVDRVLECLKLNEKETKQPSHLDNTRDGFTSPKITYKYLKGKTGKTFSRVENTPEDSFFRLNNENGDTADFEFHGNEEEAIAKRIFNDEISIIQAGSYENAHSVMMITPGKAKRIEGQWTVIERIKINLT